MLLASILLLWFHQNLCPLLLPCNTYEGCYWTPFAPWLPISMYPDRPYGHEQHDIMPLVCPSPYECTHQICIEIHPPQWPQTPVSSIHWWNSSRVDIPQTFLRVFHSTKPRIRHCFPKSISFNENATVTLCLTQWPFAHSRGSPMLQALQTIKS